MRSNLGRNVLDDLSDFENLDYDDQAFETALWEGGYDDGRPYGFHRINLDDPEDIDELDDENPSEAS